MLAALWLRAKGYRILARRVRLRVGEIDLIASKGRTVAFIEVKARADTRQGIEAVTPASWRRINRAAASWMAKRPDLQHRDWRFDLIVMPPARPPRHLRDHWRPDFA
jgi:putative endonuclease